MFEFYMDHSYGLFSDNHILAVTSGSDSNTFNQLASTVADTRVCESKMSCKLASTVEYLYNIDAKGWDSRGIIPSRKDEVIQSLVLQNYEFTCIQYYVVNKDFSPNSLDRVSHKEFERLLRAECRLGHSHLIEVDDSQIFVFQAGYPTDLLVYMALAARLLSIIGSPQNVRTLEDLETDHYNQMDNLDSICRVYKIDLYIHHVEKTKVLNTISNTIGFTTIENRLISSFVNLPIRHTENMYDRIKEEEYLTHIPMIGELTHVLFHIFLIEEFDAKFRKLYPRIPFYRLGTEVIIPIPDEYANLDIDISKLLSQLDLDGTHMSIGNDEYMPCNPYERRILTLFSGEITVWKAEEF